MIQRLLAALRPKQGLMPADFPNDEDFEIATIEYQQTGSMLAALRAVAEWRRES